MKSINEIEELIAKDDFLNAIEAAIALAESYKLYDLVKSLLKLRSRLIANHEDKKLGEKTSSEFHLEKSRITRSLLDVLDNIEEENHGFDFQRGRDIVVGSANTSTSKPGIKDVILLAKEKLNIFYKELIIASDTAIRFTLKQQIKEQKEFIEGLKEESKPYNPVGNIVCELPREMMLHNPQLVTVKIFKKDEKSKEAKKGMNAKHLVVDKLKMSEVMVVRILEADSEENIRIVPLSNIEQVIDYDDINVWKFNLIPKRVGVFTIVIRVSQKVQLPKFNTEKENDVISWVENVSIKVDQLSIKSEAVLLDVGEWNQVRKDLKTQIVKNELGQVFTKLVNFTSEKDNQLYKSFILLNANYITNENKYHSGIMSAEELKEVQAKVKGSVLNLIDRIGNPILQENKSRYMDAIQNTIN